MSSRYAKQPGLLTHERRLSPCHKVIAATAQLKAESLRRLANVLDRGRPKVDAITPLFMALDRAEADQVDAVIALMAALEGRAERQTGRDPVGGMALTPRGSVLHIPKAVSLVEARYQEGVLGEARALVRRHT